jgi:hypothetical protein
MSDLDWKREFEAMGSASVRAALMARRWDDQKRSAAREWLERTDAHSWQATRRGGGSAAEARSTMDVFRRYKWFYYVIAGGFGLLALSQIVKF